MLRTAQVLPESLRACATLPSWETRPISFLVVSPRELCYSLFWMHSLGSRASGIGMLICFTAHLQLKRMTCEFRRAGPSSFNFFAARELFVDALNRFEEQLHLCHRAGVVLHALDAVRIGFSAELASLTRGNVVGPTVGLPESVQQNL